MDTVLYKRRQAPFSGRYSSSHDDSWHRYFTETSATYCFNVAPVDRRHRRVLFSFDATGPMRSLRYATLETTWLPRCALKTKLGSMLEVQWGEEMMTVQVNAASVEPSLHRFHSLHLIKSCLSKEIRARRKLRVSHPNVRFGLSSNISTFQFPNIGKG